MEDVNIQTKEQLTIQIFECDLHLQVGRRMQGGHNKLIVIIVLRSENKDSGPTP